METKLPFSEYKRAATQQTKHSTDDAPTTSHRRLSIGSILWILFKAILFSALPFIVLIRGAVYLHESQEWMSWLALGGGILGSAILLLFYLLYWQGRLWGVSNSLKNVKRTYWLAFVLVLVYCVPGVLYLSASNAKHSEVQKEFTSLHPILRLGISTLVYLDKELLITDANRQPEDYAKMGLPTKKHSLHYEQSDGYAHAIDIRTKGQSEIRNTLIQWYFRLMGFNTLRHVGTADHLHVSLMSHDRPEGI